MRIRIPQLTKILLGGGVTLALLIGGFFLIIISGLPNPELLENRTVAQSTKIFDREKETLLYEVHGEEKRTVIPFEEIPEHVKQATIALEDQRFYEHGGFDMKGFIRGVFLQPLRGRGLQGGSTITQQLAKNAFLSPERTITRKIKELVLAMRLERRLEKNEILNLYLNQIPYGSNAYGIEAAAQTYFEKPAQELTLAEASLLASLPKAPSYYSPHGAHTDELMARKDFVLDQMAELGFISEEERNAAKKESFTFTPGNVGIQAPHFVVAVQEYLNKKYGEDFVRTGGLEVITTLDIKLQEVAERVVKEGALRNTELYNGTNAALVAQDARTGHVLALVGSRDYFDEEIDGKFNVATQGLRQPGSAIKPFAYLAAFQEGYTPETVVFDVPTEFAANNPDCPLEVDFENNAEGCYHPQNFDTIFRGPVTFREGLGQSINIPSVKALYLAGIDPMLKLVQRMGITTLTERSRYGLSLVLGGGEIKLSELVNAYSTFAQDGVARPQTFLLKITDNKGRVLEEYRDTAARVINTQDARLINDILSDVETRSGLFQSSLPLTIFPDHEIALKTGTTNDYRDAWTFGYTPSLVVGVWAGNNDNTPMQQQGSSLLAAIPIWNAFMREALPSFPPETFIKPEPIFTDHPILQGNYIVQYEENGTRYPHIHNILFYFDPQSPQFENWEIPVIIWAEGNVPNFTTTFNKPISFSSSPLSSTPQGSNLTLSLFEPVKGGFISNPFTVRFATHSDTALKRADIYLNGTLIDSTAINNTTSFSYQKNLSPSALFLQNTLRIVVVSASGKSVEEEIIVFGK